MPTESSLPELLIACRTGDLQAVEALLTADPSLATASSMLGAQPIHAAHFSNQARVVDHLLTNGVTLDFYLACELGLLNRVTTDLAADPNLAQSFSPTGATALHRACYWGQVEVARVLLDHGADPNAVTRDSFLQIHPLGAAMATPDVPNPSDQEETVLALAELLIDRGANVNGRRRDGLTALHSAAYRGLLNVLAYLLKHGADPSIQGYDGMGPHSGHTAKQVAEAQGQTGAAEMLAGAGSDA